MEENLNNPNNNTVKVANLLQSILAINSKTMQIKQENQKLKEKLTMDSFSQHEMELQLAKTPLQIKIELKRKELEEKRNQLNKAQKSLIQIRSKRAPRPKVNSTEAIPVAFNQIQKFAFQLTELAVQNSGSVQITSALKIAEAFYKILDIMVESNVITETTDEKNSREQLFLQARKQILEKMKNIYKQSNPKPESSNSKPESSNSNPESSNSNPESSNSKPESSNSKPESSNSNPESSNSNPESSNSKPESSNSKSESSNSKPEISDQILLLHQLFDRLAQNNDNNLDFEEEYDEEEEEEEEFEEEEEDSDEN